MVKITNGTNVFEVTHGAYESIYKKQGYVRVDEKVETVQKPEVPQEPEVNEDDLFVEELLEKPIGNWKGQEVKRFAEIKGIDISGTKNANEAKEIIKAFLADEANDEGEE